MLAAAAALAALAAAIAAPPVVGAHAVGPGQGDPRHPAGHRHAHSTDRIALRRESDRSHPAPGRHRGRRIGRLLVRPQHVRRDQRRGGRRRRTVRLDTANGAFTTAKPTTDHGRNGDDTLIGGSGNETFFGGRGNDVVDGNGGADTAFLGQRRRHVRLGSGRRLGRRRRRVRVRHHVFNGAGGNEILAATRQRRQG